MNKKDAKQLAYRLLNGYIEMMSQAYWEREVKKRFVAMAPQSMDETLLHTFAGLRRNCETSEWEDIDDACPGLAEPFRSEIKKLEDLEVLLIDQHGKILVKK